MHEVSCKRWEEVANMKISEVRDEIWARMKIQTKKRDKLARRVGECVKPRI
jgi:hypothetical protein